MGSFETVRMVHQYTKLLKLYFAFPFLIQCSKQIPAFLLCHWL